MVVHARSGPVSLGGLLGIGLCLALGGCRDDVPVGPDDPAPETLDGTPCDQPGILHTGVACEQCVCTEEGVLHCPRSSCAYPYVDEPEAGLLVVVDDSSSMGPDRQARLAAAMPAFLAELDAYPNPVALRVGVTTTSHSGPGCDPALADDGALQLRSCLERADDFAAPAGPTEEPIPADAAARACASVCDLPQLRSVPSAVDGTEPRSRPWLERYGRWTNLEGDVDFAEALACAIPQGLRGCDFEAPLRSATAALWRGLDPDDPAGGFASQPGALSVLVVTDEDDCSVADAWGTVLDPDGSRRFWSDPEAEAPTSAVCWNAGVVCEGGPGTYDSCAPANIDTAEHVDVPADNAVLTPVVGFLHDLQDIDDARFEGSLAVWSAFTEIAVIGGVPPGGADLVYTDGQDDPAYALRYGVGPGCLDADEAAVPPARLLDGATAAYSACDDDYGPALADVGRRLVESLPSPCYSDCAGDVDPAAAGLQPLCWAHEERYDSPDGPTYRVVPPCNGDQLPPGEPSCLLVRHGSALSSACTELGANLELGVLRDPSAPRSPGALVQALCEPSPNPSRDCPGS